MSQENVDLVRRIYALLDQGDDPHDLVAPEFVLDFSRRLLNPIVVRGRDEVRAFAEGEGQNVGRGARRLPAERVDRRRRQGARVRSGKWSGGASGVEVEAYTWDVWTFRDGKPVEVQYFGDVYEVPAAVRRLLADIEDTGPDFRLEIERLESIGVDQVLGFLRATASGRASGAALVDDLPTTNIYDLADGKIRRIRIFRDRQEALEAAGLSE
jgi:ketosteroid isomerase-like protein